jgi:hypothetical protein
MAATSGVINIVEFVSAEYADVDLSSSTVPTVLTSITADQLKQGSFSLDIPEESVTNDYTEDGETYNVRTTPSAKKAVLGLVTATAETIADLTSAVLTAGTAGSPTTPDKLKFGTSASETVTNKYVKITGKNSDGKTITVELFNAKPTYSWSGAAGKSTEPQPFTVTFNVMRHRVYGASFQISPAF